VTENLLIYGVGHSGTRIITRMYGAMGWHHSTETSHCEPLWCVTYNGMITRRLTNRGRDDDLPIDECVERIQAGWEAAPKPYCIKDPRFVLTLDLFDCFSDTTLVHVTRRKRDVAKSYLRRKQLVRGRPGIYGMTLDELIAAKDRTLQTWDGPVRDIAYEDVGANINDRAGLTALFGSDRAWEARGLWKRR
jgi:hypothetical protein